MRSDLKLTWDIFLSIIKTPFTILMVLLGKKELTEILQPFKEIIKYITEAKITFTIILINITIYFWSLFWTEKWIYALMDHPSHILSGHFYTLFTATYMHGSLAHLIGNMTVLLFLGRIVEEKFGGLKYFFLYTIVGISASIINNIVMIITGNISYTLGASGAIAGIIAAAMLYHPFRLSLVYFFPLPTFAIAWFAIYNDMTGLLYPTQTNIAYWAHMGGYIATSIILMIVDKEDVKKGFMMNFLTFSLASILWVITSGLVGNP